VPCFERLAQLGLAFCCVIPDSRDATPDVVSTPMMPLATEVRAAVAGSSTRA